MSTRLITGPSIEPVTVAEARLACRLDVTGDVAHDALVDAELLRDIAAMRAIAEHSTGRSFLPQTWEVSLDAFPADDDIQLFNPSVASITSVKYIDALTANETTLASNQYLLDNSREYEAWLLPAVGVAWPATLTVANAVRVRYLAGYADAASVPASVKKWLLSAVKFSRDGGCDGSGELPRDFNAALLDRIRVPAL